MSTISEQSEVWVPIDGAAEQLRLFEGAVATGAMIVLETPQAEFLVRAVSREGDGLRAELAQATPIPFRPGESVVARFDFGADTFTFRAMPAFQGGQVTLTSPSEFFRLQRRKHFRMVIPEGFPSNFEIEVRASGRVPIRGRLGDINAHGLSFEVQSVEKFQVDEIIEGEMQLGKRPPTKVAGRVRYAKSLGDRQQIGVEFDHSLLRTQDQVQDALLFFRHDVFHFKKK